MIVGSPVSTCPPSQALSRHICMIHVVALNVANSCKLLGASGSAQLQVNLLACSVMCSLSEQHFSMHQCLNQNIL